MQKILVGIAILLLSGCHLLGTTSGSGPGPKVPGDDSGVIVTPPIDPDPGIVIQPPPEKMVNWSASLESIVEDVVRGQAIKQNDILLVDNVINNSNTDLNTALLTSQLRQMLISTQRFSLVSEEQLTSAQQALGLQSEDSFNSRSKTIGLARYLSVPYIFYTTIGGQDSELTLSSQIMQVQTGELIWSENIPARFD